MAEEERFVGPRMEYEEKCGRMWGQGGVWMVFEWGVVRVQRDGELWLLGRMIRYLWGAQWVYVDMRENGYARAGGGNVAWNGSVFGVEWELGGRREDFSVWCVRLWCGSGRKGMVMIFGQQGRLASCVGYMWCGGRIEMEGLAVKV